MPSTQLKVKDAGLFGKAEECQEPAAGGHPGDRTASIADVLAGKARHAIVTGDCRAVLRQLPDRTVDCVVTSPPYFNQREYDVTPGDSSSLVGKEGSLQEYVASLAEVFSEVNRVLVDDGSLWLNLGDKFIGKELAGVPWRVAFALKDSGWMLRQDIVWNQLKGTQSAKDRMRNIHEYLFHFVKQKSYFFDGDKIRIKPGKASRKNGRITSASGVSGKKYYRQIQESEVLNDAEKHRARTALDDALAEMERGEIADFRMTIRGVQRIYHSDDGRVSGRAKELERQGFFLLKMRSRGFLPSTVWDIVPEDKWRKDAHCAVFPKSLVRIPLLCTCPAGGIALDPFSGTGTTVAAALELGMRGVGIDISESYSNMASRRLAEADQAPALPVH